MTSHAINKKACTSLLNDHAARECTFTSSGNASGDDFRDAFIRDKGVLTFSSLDKDERCVIYVNGATLCCMLFVFSYFLLKK